MTKSLALDPRNFGAPTIVLDPLRPMLPRSMEQSVSWTPLDIGNSILAFENYRGCFPYWLHGCGHDDKSQNMAEKDDDRYF